MSDDNDFSLLTFRPTIYKFLRLAGWFKQDKGRVLDCGAGGERPPVALFSKHGYEAYGIDNSETALDQARSFASQFDLNLNLSNADMREIPFEDEYFSVVFSYNASIHLTKADTRKAVKEMLRVLKKEGLLCMNFLWYNEVHPSLGEEKNQGEFWNREFDEETVHSFFTEEEVEEMLEDTKIMFKEKIQMKIMIKEKYFWESSFDYVVEKK